MDKHTPEQRRKNMQAIKYKDTKIEIALRQALWSRGARYRKNVQTIYGKPDIVFLGVKVAIYCDSDFWHGYDWEHKKDKIKTRRDFWLPKIERTMQRDAEVNEHLQEQGWKVMRFWGHEIEADVYACADQIVKVLKERNECCTKQ